MFEPDVQILEYFGAFRDHRSDEVSKRSVSSQHLAYDVNV